MKLSEAIAKLQQIEKEHGDMILLINQDDWGGYATHSVKKIDFFETYFDTDGLEENGLSDDDILEILPEWNKDDKYGTDIKVVTIFAGYTLEVT